jgi:hypothetical protein
VAQDVDAAGHLEARTTLNAAHPLREQHLRDLQLLAVLTDLVVAPENPVIRPDVPIRDECSLEPRRQSHLSVTTTLPSLQRAGTRPSPTPGVESS